MSFFEEALGALTAADVRFVVVGGLAVILNGHVRSTVDLDLVVDFDPAEARKTMVALTSIGLEPAIPVEAAAFADPRQRAAWIRDKHMQVFPLHDPADAGRRVDLFVSEPVPFEELWAEASEIPFAGVTIRVASLKHLIGMKREAGRPQDLADIEALEDIADE